MQTYFCPDVLWISWVSLAQAADTTSDDSWSKMWWAKRKRQQTLLNQNPTNYLGSKDFTNRLCIMYTYIYWIYIYIYLYWKKHSTIYINPQDLLAPVDNTVRLILWNQTGRLFTSHEELKTCWKKKTVVRTARVLAVKETFVAPNPQPLGGMVKRINQQSRC